MNKAFEEWWEDEKYFDRQDKDPEWTKYVWGVAYEAAESASAARIAELEADCKVMARGLELNFTHGLQCDCPACLIAAKYREVSR